MSRADWHITFQDEFRGDRLDEDNWGVNTPWTFEPLDQGEMQYYHRDAVTVGNNMLTLTAEKTVNDLLPYRSGMVHTFGRFAQRYGRFSARLRLPYGKGLWPAFWLLPDTYGPPEIDIMEAIGNPQMAYGTVHVSTTEKFSVLLPYAGRTATFTLEWMPNRIRWIVDGELVDEWRGTTPDVPMCMILNLAVGGDWPGAPTSRTEFPARFAIEWVRAWSRRKPDGTAQAQKERQAQLDQRRNQATGRIQGESQARQNGNTRLRAQSPEERLEGK